VNDLLAPEWDDLRLRVRDPDLWELVQLARHPLDLDGLLDLPPRRRVPKRVAPELARLARLVVPVSIIAEMRAHAASVTGGIETAGRLVIRDSIATRYMPLTNHATEPYTCRVASSWRPAPGEAGIIVHSHPPPCAPTPSESDLAHACARRTPAFGIFHVESGTLGIFSAATSGSFTTIDVRVRAEPRTEHGRWTMTVTTRRRRPAPLSTVITLRGRNA
jgi:proteasome lid subunit RPN8/RPN11